VHVEYHVGKEVPLEDDAAVNKVEAVCMGESMAAFVPEGNVGTREASGFRIYAAGAESNVAIWLAQLGRNAAWASRVGDDALGDRVVAELASYGVDTSLVDHVKRGRTGVMVKDPAPSGSRVVYYRSGSAATTLDRAFTRRIRAASPKVVHISGVTAAISQSALAAIEALLDWASTSPTRVSFDVNYRPALWPDEGEARETIRELGRRADLVLVGLDEAQALWGSASVGEIRDLLDGARSIVVKNGGIDATLLTGSSAWTVPALPVDVVEPVGAGDAFAAGFLHGWLDDADPSVCLRLGHLVAGFALRSTNDHAALPTPPTRLLEEATSGRPWAVDRLKSAMVTR